MFNNIQQNLTIRDRTCRDTAPPGASEAEFNAGLCSYYKGRVAILQGRDLAYSLKTPGARQKYKERDVACEKPDYDSPDVNVTVCNAATTALEDYLEIVRKEGEAKTTQDAVSAARRAAGLLPNQPKPAWFVETVPVGFDMLFTADAKLQAVTRLGAKNAKLRANVEIEKVRLNNAKASIDIGVGVGKVCGGDFYHDDGCCCRSDIVCSGDPGKAVWESGHWACRGGDSIGKLNADGAGGERLPCPSSHPDRIDGLCYRSCPSSHPLHIKGMPYLCAKSADTDGAIRDQFNYDNYDKADAEHAISCAEAVVNKNQAGIEEHCGFDARAKSKAAWEDVAVKAMSWATSGVWDLVNLAGGAASGNSGDWTIQKQLFGHANRGGAVFDASGNYVGGEKGAADRHIDGVIDAFLRTKDIATEEACVKAIDDKNLTNYLKYCPLFEEVKPTVLDASGQPQLRAILPPELPHLQTDAAGNLTDAQWQITPSTLPPWDVPEVPVFNEDLLPAIPQELLDALPDDLMPRPDKPDMIPPAWPDDIANTPTHPPLIKDSLPPTNYNLLDHPTKLLMGGAFLLALLSIA